MDFVDFFFITLFLAVQLAFSMLIFDTLLRIVNLLEDWRFKRQ